MIFFDTESVGQFGPLVTIQWFNDDTKKPCWSEFVNIHRVWDEPVEKTLWLMEYLTGTTIVGFNLSHDWFVVNKWYNIFSRVPNERRSIPPDPIEIRRIEETGPHTRDKCLRPTRACDLMLIARAGKYQYLAKHKSIIIRKVPVQLCHSIIQEMGTRVSLPNGVSLSWRVSEKRTGARNDVKDLIGEFAGLSTSLKTLSAIINDDRRIAEQTFATEVGITSDYKDVPDWRPWSTKMDASWDYPLRVLRRKFNDDARAIKYAISDVVYTYQLWEDLGKPNGGDDDSELACLVGASHWKGFSTVPVSQLEQYYDKLVEEESLAPTAPAKVIAYLSAALDDTEKLIFSFDGKKKKLEDTTNDTLEELRRWEGHPVAVKAALVIRARAAQKRKDYISKLIKAGGRFHFSMKVVGALSSRMAGGSEVTTKGTGKRLNPQGIPRETEFRSLFTLAFDGEEFSGGDFDGFEATIAEAVCKDPQLTMVLRSGKKLHAYTGSKFYGCTYEEMLKTKGEAHSKYDRAKKSFFSWIYRATNWTMAQHLDLDPEETEAATEAIAEEFNVIDKYFKELGKRFTPIQQPGGPGTEIFWTEPEPFVESILGFRRYFTLEWAVVKGLYEIAVAPPIEWKEIKGDVRRTNRVQTVLGATQSALYSGIFALQAHVFRAAANHEIQSPGAQITKKVQRAVWDLQPCGIGPWLVRPINIHDEVLVVSCHSMEKNQILEQEPNVTYAKLIITQPEKTISGTNLQKTPGELDVGFVVNAGTIEDVVQQTVAQLQQQIPLLKMTWKKNLKNWGEKD